MTAMTADEQRTWAERIVDTWPGGTKAYVWRNLLRRLGAERELVEATYTAMLAEAPRNPPPSMFYAVYRGAEQRTVGRSAEPAGCSECDGHGWRTVTETRFGQSYSGAIPCTCDAGTAHVDAHRRIVSFNDRELSTLSADRTPPSTHLRAEWPGAPVSNGPTMTFDEYFAVQKRKAASGDLEAAENVVVWERNLANRSKRAAVEAMFDPTQGSPQ